MTVSLGLYAEFGDVKGRDDFARSFPRRDFPLLMGGTIQWEVNSWEPRCGGPAVEAHSFDLPDQGLPNLRSAIDHTAIGFRLFHLLNSVSNLLFARVGFEASQFSSCELAEFVDGNSHYLKLEDCVIANELYESLGRPLGLQKFNPLCYWTKWQGVNYNPLHGQDAPELRKLVEELFPGMYFNN
jgi:hypothetical protein